ncbi:MAG: Rieske 2Fe-2S domain-containing protein [Conexivisphaerales archaeon]
MTAEGQDDSRKASKVSRRNFVVGVGAGAVVAAVAVAGAESLLKSKSTTSVVTSTVTGPTTTVTGPTTTVTSTVTGTATSTVAAGGFPTVKVASLSGLSVNAPVAFNYPLADEPSVLVKLGQKAAGGVGPDGDIVAFSLVCQHLGCTPSSSFQYVALKASPTCNSGYQAAGPLGYCCCHGSVYDFVNGGKVLSGPAPLPLPQVMLEVDSSGDIYAYAMGPPTIYGHSTGNHGSYYVFDDLQG